MDPVRAITIKRWISRGASLTLLAGLSAWAAWPLRHVGAVKLHLHAEEAPLADELSPIGWDQSAFTVALWRLPPEPPPPPREQKAPRVSPPAFELVGIVNERDGRLLAALYDPEANEMRQVAAGDSIGTFKVDIVEPSLVRLSQGSLRHEIALKTGRDGG